MLSPDQVVDQPVDLLPEEKVGLLLELINVALFDLVSEQGDIDLDMLAGLNVEFAEDGSLKLSLVQSEGEPIVQVEDASVIESVLQDIALDKQEESMGMEE